MIKIKGVSKSFGDIVALEDISFEIDKGELVFITGPSGAGKSTLINLILGSIHPDKGKIVIDGTKVSEISKKDLPKYRQQLGVVFQDYKILPERTLRENIELALAVSGAPQDEWEKRVDDVLTTVGLLERAELFPAQISGGELQRTAIARALVVEPSLVLADEPTGNLDWDTAESIVQLLADVNKQGKTVIITSHHKDLVDKFAKRKIELEKGMIKGTKPEKKVKVKTKEKK